ncbi:MAG: glycosyltransferase family 2 protein [SAR324 cluster bacterium]|nr:glycosyltransferase family 2 protein [SAR324 cluster bacterium]
MKNKTGSPFISIIMNCYNSETYLREAVESVIKQTYSDWELIFWDNQSTDGSAEIIHSYDDPRICYFYAPTHTNLGEARKKAAQKVSGEWLAFLDCDDLWLPDKLKKQINLIEEEKGSGSQLGLIYGYEICFNEDREDLSTPATNNGKPLPEGDILPQLLEDNFISATNVMILKKAYLQVGGFPENFKYAPDYFLSCAVARHFKTRAVQENISKYRKHTASVSSQAEMWSIAKQEMIRVLTPYVKDFPSVRKRILKIKFQLFKKRFFNQFACVSH